MLQNVKKLIFDASLPKMYFRHTEANNRLANLEELVLNDYKVPEMFIWGTKLRKVTIQNSSDTSPIGLSMDNSFLSLDSIFSDRKFYKLQLKRTKVTDMERLYSMLDFTTYATHPTLSKTNADLQLNGGKYNRQTMAGVDDGTINPTNQIREIDMSRIPSQLRILLIRHNLLTKMENVNHPNLTNTELQNNLLWSLDLSSVTSTSGNYRITPQKPYADL
ncbi:MAG: hypothetical protein IKN21_05210, partial [Prevotella sp.]|nr:hypothetical protein [Prevotella sp.]